jgi:hypothetical protein
VYNLIKLWCGFKSMKSLLTFLLLCIALPFPGCGNVFIRGALPAGSSTVSGSVSVVQLSAVIGENGTTVQVTFVTFLQSGASSTVGFCGDRRDQFPMQQIVRADFNPGTPCASIITILIL